MGFDYKREVNPYIHRRQYTRRANSTIEAMMRMTFTFPYASNITFALFISFMVYFLPRNVKVYYLVQNLGLAPDYRSGLFYIPAQYMYELLDFVSGLAVGFASEFDLSKWGDFDSMSLYIR